MQRATIIRTATTRRTVERSTATAMRLAVVLPTYNERETLPPLVDALLGLDLRATDLDVLVVDDNSPDGTGALADALAADSDGRVDVLHRERKKGLGPAYRAGFRRAIDSGADLVLQMDCDFSHQPRYIAEMLAVMEAQDADMVLGSRFAPGGSVDACWPWKRRALSVFANKIYLRAILGLDLADATGGFRLWKRETLIGLDIDRRVRSNGYAFQVEMAYLATRLGYRVVETPIHFPDRTAGTSKMDLRIAFGAARRAFDVRRRHGRLRAVDRAQERVDPPSLRR